MQVPTGIFDHDTIVLMIIKVLAEKKNQSADEVRRAITKDGADGVVGNKVLDGMIRSRSYFDRTTGNGSGARYSLKKQIAKDYKASGIDNMQKMLVAAVKETGLPAEAAAKLIDIAGSQLGGLVDHAESTAMRLAMTNAKKSFETPRSPHDQFEKQVRELADELPVGQEKDTPVEVNLEHVFDPMVDTIEVAIWKAMADGKQYSVAELQVLLADAKVFAPKSISAKLTVLRRNKQIVRAVNRQGTTIMYELIPGYPMPAHSGRTEPKAPYTKGEYARAPNPKDDPTVPPNTLAPKAPEVVIPKETNIVKEEPEMKKVNPPVTVKPTTSILEVSIKVRGVEMPLSELKAIVGVFDSVYNVRDEKHDEPNKIVAVNYTVGTTVYSLADARELVLAYKNHFE